MEAVILLSTVGGLIVTPIVATVATIKRRPIRAVKFVEKGGYKGASGEQTAKMITWLLSAKHNPNRLILDGTQERVENALAILRSNPRWGQWEDLAKKRQQREGGWTNIINGLSNI